MSLYIKNVADPWSNATLDFLSVEPKFEINEIVIIIIDYT